jgi:hypothetical protein
MEFFKFIGAAVGIITGIFTAIDWLFRGTPHAYITIAGNKRDRILVIQNTTQYSIFISAVKSDNEALCFSETQDEDNIIEAQFNPSINKIINPRDVYHLYIFSKYKNGLPAAFDKKNFKIKIHWRRGDNTAFYRIPMAVKGLSSDVIENR